MTFSTGLALKTKSIVKENILQQAKELVSNDRESTHGDARQNHEQIAEFWNIFLDNKLKPMAAITCDDVAVMIADYTEKLFGEKKADGGRIRS